MAYHHMGTGVLRNVELLFVSHVNVLAIYIHVEKLLSLMFVTCYPKVVHDLAQKENVQLHLARVKQGTIACGVVPNVVAPNVELVCVHIVSMKSFTLRYVYRGFPTALEQRKHAITGYIDIGYNR